MGGIDGKFMQCPIRTKENPEVLIEYSSGRLTPAVAAMFQSHVESCADCRAFSKAQRAAWDALDSWEPMPITADFDRKLYARIDEYEKSGWWTKLWHRSTWQSGSFGSAMPIATACVTLAVGVMLYLPLNNKPAMDLSAPQTKIESSDLDQIETTLEDIEMFKQLTPAAARS